MSRRFLGALARGDLSEIRRELLLVPLLQRSPQPDPEEKGVDPGVERTTTPSDEMALPKPPSQTASSIEADA